jgi:hypothetical protein
VLLASHAILQCFELESCEHLLHLPLEMSTLTQLQRLSLSHQHLEEGFPWHLTGLSQVRQGHWHAWRDAALNNAAAAAAEGVVCRSPVVYLDQE